MNKSKLSKLELIVRDKKDTSKQLGVVIARQKGELFSVRAGDLEKLGATIPGASPDEQEEGYILIEPKSLEEALQDKGLIVTVLFTDTPLASSEAEVAE